MVNFSLNSPEITELEGTTDSESDRTVYFPLGAWEFEGPILEWTAEGIAAALIAPQREKFLAGQVCTQAW